MKLLSIIAIVLAILAICTRAEDQPVLINELATIGEQYIEFKKKNVGVVDLNNYGVVIAEQVFIERKRNLRIRAALDLSGKLFINPYIQLIHFGNSLLI